MAFRPKLSEETRKKVNEWLENNSDKGPRTQAGAVEYLIEKAINEKNIEERIDELEKEISE